MEQITFHEWNRSNLIGSQANSFGQLELGPSITQWWQKIHFQGSLEEWNFEFFLISKRKQRQFGMEEIYSPVNWSNGLYIHHELSGLKEYWRVLRNFVKKLLLKLFVSKAANHKQNFNFSFFKASLLNLWMYFFGACFQFPAPWQMSLTLGCFFPRCSSVKQAIKKKTRWGWKSSIFPMRNTSRNCGFSMAMLDLFKRIQSKNSKSISWRLMNFESLIELFNLMKFYLTSFGTTFSFNSNSIPEYTLDCPPSQYKWQMKV